VEKDQQEQLVIVVEVEPRLWARESAQSSDAGAKLAEAAIAAIRRAIADQHEVVPSIIVLVSAQGIPRTSSGKLRRYECRTQFLSGQLAGILSDSPHGEEPGCALNASGGAQ
jgi:acyl-coenzyme A synthetase/AMP-(fatty) acid ligase